MRRYPLFLGLVFSACFAARAQAPDLPFEMKAASLQKDCEGFSRSAFNISCAGYIMGVIDGIVGMEVDTRTDVYCVRGSDYMQQVMVVKKWLDSHPEHWHWTRYMAVRAALVEAFPCRGGARSAPPDSPNT